MRHVQSDTSIGGWLSKLVARFFILALILVLIFGCSSLNRPEKERSYDMRGIITCNVKRDAEKLLGEITINVYQAIELSRNFPQVPKSCRYTSGIVVVHERIKLNGLWRIWIGSDGSKWFLFSVTVSNQTEMLEDIFMLVSTFTPKGQLV